MCFYKNGIDVIRGEHIFYINTIPNKFLDNACEIQITNLFPV